MGKHGKRVEWGPGKEYKKSCKERKGTKKNREEIREGSKSLGGPEHFFYFVTAHSPFLLLIWWD